MNLKETKICVVGLGYVGLPLAVEFAKTSLAPVIGFDINQEKVTKLQNGIDPTQEVGNQVVKKAKIEYTADPSRIKEANFIIVAVPTPIKEAARPGQLPSPDLSLVESASHLVGQNLAAGSIVVYESTVYPGVTRDICLPILEKESGLKGGADFKIGYSPERVNPGDKEHTIGRVVKIVSGQDAESLEKIAAVYGLICQAGVHQAPTIEVAEAAKVIENIQRDLNIALVNELALIFDKLSIDTQAVLAAAGTKWNFHRYHPGLVGGHCIGVDPSYLIYKSIQAGYEPSYMIAGRNLNESMASFVAQKVISNLAVKSGKVLVLGMTFKENVNDFRNSKSFEVAEQLKQAGCQVFINDPMAEVGYLEKNFGWTNSPIENLTGLDAIVYLVPHQKYSHLGLNDLKTRCSDSPVLFDLRRIYDKVESEKFGFKYLTL